MPAPEISPGGLPDYQTATAHNLGAFTTMGDSATPEFTPHGHVDVKVSHVENGQASGGYEPATKLERLPRELDREPHELFIEMDELVLSQEGLYEWKQKARYIKFEETVLEGAERWGNPRVPSLSFHSVLQLKKCIETGTVILDLDETDLQGIANAVVDQMIADGHLSPKHRGCIVSSLLLKHTFMDDNKGFLRKSSHAIIGMVNLEEGQTLEPKVGGHFGVRKSRFSEPHMFHHSTKKDEALLPEDTYGAHANGVGIVNKDLQLDDEGVLPHPGSLKRSAALAGSSTSIVVDLDLMKKIPKGAQTTSVLVGTLDYLEKPVMAFVRLSRGRYLGNFTQVPLPVRFLFFLMGPRDYDFDYVGVGRSISTLMSDKKFNEVAYKAHKRQDLLRGVNDFLDDSLVLPPGELDKRMLMPILNMAKEKARKRKERRAAREKALQEEKAKAADGGGGVGGGGAEEPEKPKDPLARTGRPFGGMWNDMKLRFPMYVSDIRDGFNLQCLSATLFIFFAAVSPAITFGGLLQTKVDNWMGVTEMLLGCFFVGVIFHLLAAQPLLIVGFTGPLLVFETALYQICGSFGIEYMPFRLWVGIWVAIITALMVGFELLFMLRFITRFTEEIFSAFISLIFIIEVFMKYVSIFKQHPLRADYEEDPTAGVTILGTTDYPMQNGTTELMFNERDWSNSSTLSFNDTAAMIPKTTEKGLPLNQPNTALLSLILTVATFAIAYYLRIFRNGRILGRSARRALGDFGVPLSIFIMVIIDVLIKETYTEKLAIPDGLKPTAGDRRGWLIPAFGDKTKLPVWAYFFACVPAFLVFILMFMESMITTIILSKKMPPKNKGPGYHWSMMIIGCFAAISGIMGLPFLCATCVRSVTHTNALQVFGNTQAPGEKPVLQEVKEQRISGLAVSIITGLAVLIGPVLRLIPLAVLFGVFLYIGIASFSGVQLFERLWLVFKPVKYHPDIGYVKKVRTWKMHMWTFTQIATLATLWIVKSTPAALAFPFVLILIVPFRRLVLPKFFTQDELNELDKGAELRPPNQPIVYDSDADDDFYTEMHKAV